jgi:hypothetical protein
MSIPSALFKHPRPSSPVEGGSPIKRSKTAITVGDDTESCIQVSFFRDPTDASKWVVSFCEHHTEADVKKILVQVDDYQTYSTYYGFQVIVDRSHIAGIVGVLLNLSYEFHEDISKQRFDEGKGFGMIHDHDPEPREIKTHVFFFVCLGNTDYYVVTFDCGFDDEEVKKTFSVQRVITNIPCVKRNIAAGQQYYMFISTAMRLVGQLRNANFVSDDVTEHEHFYTLEDALHERKNFKLYLEV